MENATVHPPSPANDELETAARMALPAGIGMLVLTAVATGAFAIAAHTAMLTIGAVIAVGLGIGFRLLRGVVAARPPAWLQLLTVVLPFVVLAGGHGLAFGFARDSVCSFVRKQTKAPYAAMKNLPDNEILKRYAEEKTRRSYSSPLMAHLSLRAAEMEAAREFNRRLKYEMYPYKVERKPLYNRIVPKPWRNWLEWGGQLLLVPLLALAISFSRHREGSFPAG